MDDVKLADRLVELLDDAAKDFGGAGAGYDESYWHDDIGSWLTAESFIHHWCIAGKCLEQWPTTINVEHLQLTLDKMLRCPVAICEAFVHAMRQSTGNRND